MERYILEVTDYAYQNIREIKDSIISEFDSIENAEVVEKYIIDEISTLKTFPKSHRLYEHNDRLVEKLHVATARKKYNIYYTVDEKRKLVKVISVIHARRNIYKILNDKWGKTDENK